MAKKDDETLRFILDTIPDPILDALRTLASLKYPINDEAALHEALAAQDDTDDRDLTAIIEDAVGPPCFPLASPRNALEKFHDRLPVAFQLPKLPQPTPGIFDSLDPRLKGPTVERSRDLRPSTVWRNRLAEEEFWRYWACTQSARRKLEHCMAGALDVGDRFRCEKAYEADLKDCGHK